MPAYSSFRSLGMVLLVAAASIAPAGAAQLVEAPAGQAEAAGRGASGLPLPRFVSLKSGRVNARIGPGINYPVDWLYLKPGLPMEIIQEYDTWRRVRDADGTEGWINQALLSGKRTGIIAPWQKGKQTEIRVLAEPESNASPVILVEPGVIGRIKTCNGSWCEMSIAGHEGWLSQSLVWGAYPGETIAD